MMQNLRGLPVLVLIGLALGLLIGLLIVHVLWVFVALLVAYTLYRYVWRRRRA